MLDKCGNSQNEPHEISWKMMDANKQINSHIIT